MYRAVLGPRFSDNDGLYMHVLETPWDTRIHFFNGIKNDENDKVGMIYTHQYRTDEHQVQSAASHILRNTV